MNNTKENRISNLIVVLFVVLIGILINLFITESGTKNAAQQQSEKLMLAGFTESIPSSKNLNYTELVLLFSILFTALLILLRDVKLKFNPQIFNFRAEAEKIVENQKEFILNFSREKESKNSIHEMESKIVNTTELKTLSRGNNQFIVELIDLFTEQNPKDILQLEKAIAANELGEIKSQSHKMKTSVGFLGMTSLLLPLTRLEKLADSLLNINEIKTIFEKLNQDCKKSLIELHAFKNELLTK